MTREPEAPEEESAWEGPSKSARKRAAHDAERLGMRLLELPDSDLNVLGLPERLLDALVEARRIRSRGAAVRQRQYIGRLMRDIDPEEIEASLQERDRRRTLETRRQKLIESWRTRLLREGEAALDALMQDLVAAKRVARTDWVAGVGPTVSGLNGGGDPFHTDGEIAFADLAPGCAPAAAPVDVEEPSPRIAVRSAIYSWILAARGLFP